MPDYQQKEAFCLMKYASRDGQIVEWIWNSRDAITPFGLTARDGTTSMQHVQWQFDVCIPNYKPLPGERVFVDLTLEAARALRKEYVDQWWETPIEGYGTMKDSGQYPSKEAAVETLAKSDFEQFDGHNPHVITGEEYLAQLN